MAWFNFDLKDVRVHLNDTHVSIAPKNNVASLPCEVTGYGIPGIIGPEIPLNLASIVFNVVRGAVADSKKPALMTEQKKKMLAQIGKLLTNKDTTEDFVGALACFADQQSEKIIITPEIKQWWIDFFNICQRFPKGN